MKTVGVYEAKTHLPRLLAEVDAGETIVITRHGKPVARLMPIEPPKRNIDDLIAELREIRARTLPDPEGWSLKDLINEGRRQ
jgi:prevent-host-death family protein